MLAKEQPYTGASVILRGVSLSAVLDGWSDGRICGVGRYAPMASIALRLAGARREGMDE